MPAMRLNNIGSMLVNTKKETQFSSNDAFFQIDAKPLATQPVVVIYNTPGYPQNQVEQLFLEAYTLNTISPVAGTGTLTMRAKEDLSNAIIAGWNGQKLERV